MNNKNSQGFKGNGKKTFRGQTSSEIAGLNGIDAFNSTGLSSENQKNHRKDLQLLMKIFGETDFNKFEESYFGKSYDMCSNAHYSNEYNEGGVIFDYIDILISNKVKIKKGSLMEDYLREFFAINIDAKDEKKWDDMKLWYIKEDEVNTYKSELELLKNGIVSDYKSNKSSKSLISLINEGIRSNHDETLKLLKEENKILKLVKNKRIDLENRVNSCYDRKNNGEGNKLEGQLSIDEGRYELELRESGNLDRLNIKVVIIEDLERIRNNIIDILPKELGNDINVKFVEIDNLFEAKEYIDMQGMMSKIGDKVFYLLDNRFFRNKRSDSYTDMRSTEPDLGVECYEGIGKNNNELLNKIAVISSDDNVGDKFPDGANIINGKSIKDITYISYIAKWIKNSLN